jgi:plastocyanin
MVNRTEGIARVLLALILIGLPALLLGYQYVLRPQLNRTRTIDISASISENGGFQPTNFTAVVGETMTLRFTSLDVTHGVAIGPGLGMDLGHVDPGHVEAVTLTFDHPGTYTFYCNTWCSPNHWRMRGVIEVRDPLNPNPVNQVDSVIAALATEGVDIDASLNQSMNMTAADTMPVFDERPSALRGAAISADLDIPPELQNQAWRRSHTPMQGIALLLTRNPDVSQRDLADTVAYLWLNDRSTETRADTTQYYAQNCAACHGESGGGDGFMASQTAETPAAFSNLNYLFGMRDDVLYAKIRRGGMGTDMPNFGTLITPEETWALVDYLWVLALQMDQNND